MKAKDVQIGTVVRTPEGPKYIAYVDAEKKIVRLAPMKWRGAVKGPDVPFAELRQWP